MFDLFLRRLKIFYSSSQIFRKLSQIYFSSPIHKFIVSQTVMWKTRLPTSYNLIIETVNSCNASCLMCPYREMKRARSVMDDATFDKIISRLQTENLHINKVFFSGMGEPLLDRKILDRVSQIQNLGLHVKLYTNASLLTKDISDRIIEIGVSEMNISFNGANKKNYEKVMKLDYMKANQNIKYLLRARKGKSLPVIRISSVLTKENEYQTKKHLSRWNKIVDSVGVSIAHEWGGSVNNTANKATFEKNHVFPCRSLWHTLNIDSKGNFVICCRDYESTTKLGSIFSHSFKDIIEHPTIKKFQSLHLKQDIRELPAMCLGCNFPYQEGVEWFMPRSGD